MRRFFISLAAATVATVGLTLAVVHPGSAASAAGATDADGRGIVYLLRGGFNIFSTGMDDLAAELRAEDINAQSIGFMSWRDVADQVAKEYAADPRPIVIGGHSFGANAAVLAAEELGHRNIPVALVVLFDPTDRMPAPANVQHLINFISSDSRVHDNSVQVSAGSPVQVENVLFGQLSHIQIDNDLVVQQRAIAEIERAISGGRQAAAQ